MNINPQETAINSTASTIVRLDIMIRMELVTMKLNSIHAAQHRELLGRTALQTRLVTMVRLLINTKIIDMDRPYRAAMEDTRLERA